MIRLQFSTTETFASEAIRVFERGLPSHVDVVLDNGSLLGARDDAIGGRPRGVQIRPPAYEVWSRTWIVELLETPNSQTRLWGFLESQLGKPYDETAIAGMALGRDWRSTDAWFCSELVAAGLEVSGWFTRPLCDGVNAITPRDLMLILSPWNVGP